MPPHYAERCLIEAAALYGLLVSDQQLAALALNRLAPALPGAKPEAAGGPLLERVLAALLSPDGRRIMNLIAREQPAHAKGIVSGSCLERSKCYVLLADLVARGLIAEIRGGYVIADRELWEAARNSAESQAA